MSIKSYLKNNKFVMKLYDKCLPYYCIYFTKPAVKMLYKQTFGKKLNLDNPKDLNEKINWLKVYRYKNDPLVIQCADKYRVRKYIEDCNCAEILNEIYGVFYDYKKVSLSELPKQFVLKLNRGAGMNLICTDKSKLNEKDIKELLRKWFHSECGERYGELHYRKTQPCVICEKYLGNENGDYPTDYKVYTFGGKAHMVEICVERREKVKFLYVDTSYKRIDYGETNYDGNLPDKPDCFDKIIEYAEKLSKPFCHVRVDFYVYNGNPVFGEMTFTNNGGFDKVINQRGLQAMGDLLVLPDKK